MSNRYFLKMAYDGTAYHGWQVQPNGVTVQELTERALAITFGARLTVTAAGRTDTGVHAREMYAHFDLDHEITQETLEQAVYKLNNLLPADIAIHQIIPVPADAHARFDAVSRTYEYHILRQKNPFRERFAWYWQGQLDLEAMNQAAMHLIGLQDFQCFSKVHTDVNNYLCEVTRAGWHQDGDTLVFTITANRFLRNMVRAVVGTLFEVGRGKLLPDDLITIIASRDRSRAGSSVPAKGLSLTQVQYPR
jgi:tRNA pseudouridine38-40 synthase